MNAAAASSSSRGRSRTRSQKRSRGAMVSASRSMSRASGSGASSGYSKSFPYRSNWSNQLADPFPSRTTAVLRFSKNLSLDASVPVAANNVFRANSIFDPDQTGIGTQPYGHDQYAAIYGRYRVKAAYITVQNTSTGNNACMGVTVRASTSLTVDAIDLREIKGTVWTPLANTPDSKKISQKWNLSDMVSTDGTEAVFGTNPASETYFHVWVSSNGIADPAAVGVAVDIAYVVEMWDPLRLAAS